MATPVYGANTSLFSVSAWVKPSSSIASKAIMGKAEEMRLATDADGKPLCQIKSSSSWQTAVSSQTAITTGTWSHIVCTYDLVTFKIYINGELKGMQALTAVVDDTAAVWKIGKDDSASTPYGFYQGLVDEYKFFNYALTSDEVKMDYDRGMSAQMGSVGGTSGTGAASNSASAEYCVPGDTTSCAAPIAEWKMDEKVSGDSKTIYDTSGSGNNGTTVDGANNTGMNCSVPGKFGSGCSFDGVDDYVDMGTSPSLQSDSFTVSGWFRGSANQNSFGTLFEKGFNSGGTNYNYICKHIYTGPAGTIICSIGNGTSSQTSSGISVPIDTWYYVTFSANGSYVDIYINGVNKYHEAQTVSVPLAGSGYPLYIGRFSNQGVYYKGSADNVRIYNYARTPAQIAWEYNKGKPVAEWRMNECQGGTIHDESGNGNNGTISLGSGGTQTTTLGNGTCLTAGTTPWYNGRSGKYGASLNFDGTDDYTDIPYADFRLSSGSSYTACAWVKLYNVTDATRRFLFETGDSDTTQYPISLGWGNDNVSSNYRQNVFEAYTGSTGVGNVYVQSTTHPSANTWYHVCTRADASSSKLAIFVDGMEEGETDISFTIPASNGLHIGTYRKADGRWMYGQIDDVKIFNYALTAEQVKTLYNDSSAVNFGN